MRIVGVLGFALIATALCVAVTDALLTDRQTAGIVSTNISDVASLLRSTLHEFAGSSAREAFVNNPNGGAPESALRRLDLAGPTAREAFLNNPDGGALESALRLPLWLVLAFSGIGLSLLLARRRLPGSTGPLKVRRGLSKFLFVLGTGLLVVSTASVIYAISAATPQADATFLTVGQVWEELHSPSYEQLRSYPSENWRSVLDASLRLPAVLICAVLGLALLRAAAANSIAAVRGSDGTPLPEGPTANTSQFDQAQGSELSRALTSCKSAFLSVALISGVTNVLMMTGALFMLQIYDRILPSRSVPTLVALAILVGVLFAFLALLDLIRNRILVRIASFLDESLSQRVYETVVRLPLKTESRGDGLRPLRDLDTVRTFMSSPGPTALFDLPWMPVYLGIIFSFHTMLGVTAMVGALILVALALATERLASRSVTAASGFAQTRNVVAEASQRNAEVVAAMGMGDRLGKRWAETNQKYRAINQNVSDVTGGLGSISKALRMMLQSAVLGVGAYLVINEAATAGIIIAASILAARALAPVDTAIANWRGFVAARQSWSRLNRLLGALAPQATPMALPAPQSSLSVEHIHVVPPGTKKVVVQDVSFSLQSGQGLGIIGPSASGKSSLVRTIVGAWEPARGRIRLDGAALDQWSPSSRGNYMGYLPQDVELLSGTIAENIARFEPNADPKAIIAAAEAAGVHDLIVALPEGYETEIGEQGQVLSAGQRQRIGLARALYREPFLVVLDEPNSNLDSEGEAALTGAVAGVRNRGGIVIVVAHRPSALSVVDVVLVMAKGRAAKFGPKDEVLSKVLRPKAVSNEKRAKV